VKRPLLVGDLFEGSRHRGEAAAAARCYTCGLRLGSGVFEAAGKSRWRREATGEEEEAAAAAAVEKGARGIGEGILADGGVGELGGAEAE